MAQFIVSKIKGLTTVYLRDFKKASKKGCKSCGGDGWISNYRGAIRYDDEQTAKEAVAQLPQNVSYKINSF